MVLKNLRSKKVFFKAGIFVAIISLFIFLAFKLTPWPSALLIRYAFEKDANQTNQKLEKYLPKGISEKLNIVYDSKDNDAKLDIYYPKNMQKKLPLIVWVHGGGWISGDKSQSSNYFKILSSNGYIVASIDYSIAPEKKYPTPVRQTMAALKFLDDNSTKFNIDSGSIFLAGDSGGAHIVAQTANIISETKYAKLISILPTIERSKLKGLILYCGPYNIENVNLDGDFGSFLKTVLWSYSGKKNFNDDDYFKTASIINYIGTNFPPCFISAGNSDPLLIQSKELAGKLYALNIKIDTLFFPQTLSPKLPHEYQFNLDVEAGKTALNRSVEFVIENQ